MAHYYYATVENNKDPEKLGRIKVHLAMLGKDAISHWLPILSPFASSQTGLFMLPEKGDQVVVAYLDERHTQGFILGTLWNAKTPPPQTKQNPDADLNKDGKNSLKFLQTKSGQQIIFDDTKDKEKIQILDPEGTTLIEFDHKEKTITLKAEKALSIQAKKSFAITAKELTITTDKVLSFDTAGVILKSSKAVNLTTEKALAVDAQAVKLN